MMYFRFLFNFFFAFVFAAVLFSTEAVAQNDSEERLLFKESEGLVYNNPDEALKVALHLLSKSTSGSENSEINLLIAEIYKVKGDYSNALTHLFEAGKEDADQEPFSALKTAVAKSEVLRTLYLDRQAGKYYQEAVGMLSSVTDEKEKKFCQTLLLLEETGLLLERQSYSKALDLIEKNSKEIDETSKAFPYFDLWFTIFKGRIFSGLNDFDKGAVSFNRALELIVGDGNKNNYAEAFVLVGLANVNFHNKQHQLAVPQLLKALKTAKTFNNIYLSREISKLLVDNYIALNDKVNYKLYNAEFFKLNAEVENGEQESVNTAYNLIAKEYESGYEGKRQGYFRKLYVVLGIFAIVAILSAAFWFRLQWDQKRLKEIISYLEITRSNFVILTAEKKEKKNGSKKTHIPEETEQLILKKLKRFESSTRFTNNDMSIAVLAGQFDTNTKYLSEIINTHYGVNFNTYINKLRINHIVEKLKSDPNFMNYKISYLAESCGFSSHSSFATVFKSITGIAPVTFIELLKNEKEISNP
ncbi:hypothetical protein FLJC2902T_14020 [Flavobacterium limnosediminis JC2902]|uniref:HTH araC/xylS-type domain-containing protein n=1 Tax=Flavobacterium limnosediminis JC2902 TaxID=1341181 RepID=V6SWM0_9FLAO|nr:AraC family transcriptional regulator [Flavobacterium limnosediminis]ESU28805.1 hypothetical protein FLJC2902T_14020 [Flavobacterium limnosediminis JC2902]